VTYNLDDIKPDRAADPNSIRAYMHRHLLRHVDLAPNRAHVLDGTVPEPFAAEHAAAFDRWIAADGGLDLQLLGIGRNGHIGFNEPADLPVAGALSLPSARSSSTRRPGPTPPRTSAARAASPAGP
jgi:glucosamine-6-phosphate deaminase